MLICIVSVFVGISFFTFDRLEYRDSYNMLTTILFAMITVAQVFVLILLYAIILRHFKGDLEREYGLLVKCQSVLAASYIVRCILIAFVYFKMWIDFNRDYPTKGTPFTWAMLPLEFILYNFAPYMILICAHWYNATTQRDQEFVRHGPVNQSIFDS